MPDKKTLEKAKKAGEESEDEMQEAMPPEEEMPMGDDMGAEMGADMGDDMGMEAEGMDPAGGPEEALQSALDNGVSNAQDLMSMLSDAGFEVVPVGGMDDGGMGELPPPPTGAPDTAGGLRDQVRGAAARALGGM
tara:strand:+ start:7732 stop:8136 length:405 start_codon:yes stop_codon:yes gene_type:complete